MQWEIRQTRFHLIFSTHVRSSWKWKLWCLWKMLQFTLYHILAIFAFAWHICSLVSLQLFIVSSFRSLFSEQNLVNYVWTPWKNFPLSFCLDTNITSNALWNSMKINAKASTLLEKKFSRLSHQTVERRSWDGAFINSVIREYTVWLSHLLHS